MKINEVNHIAINTLDINETIEFYKEALHLPLIEKVDCGDLMLAYMKIKENSFLELFDLKGNCKKGILPEEQQGLRHIAFEVEEITAWYEHLKKVKVKFVQHLTAFEPVGNNVILFEDPNGVVIELCEKI